ncbi:hypothetical protein RND81_05G219800 [Saponaria officinalis]|uniref:Uncharacterized protein n=1 Tax=Saponaria officinalis TaxID=3572 RepID=A0AAW1L0Q7_SAPOF
MAAHLQSTVDSGMALYLSIFPNFLGFMQLMICFSLTSIRFRYGSFSFDFSIFYLSNYSLHKLIHLLQINPSIRFRYGSYSNCVSFSFDSIWIGCRCRCNSVLLMICRDNLYLV